MKIARANYSDKINQQPLAERELLQREIAAAWQVIAPLWPSQTIIARNPLLGLEDKKFTDAFFQGYELFEKESISEETKAINRFTIKWCELFFDQGQASIPMPGRHKGFYNAWRELSKYDMMLHKRNSEVKKWLLALPEDAEETVHICLKQLNIKTVDYHKFIKSLLVSLPGWAGYVKHQVEGQFTADHPPVSFIDYLAVRLCITCIIWPQAACVLQDEKNQLASTIALQDIKSVEIKYRKQLLTKLKRGLSIAETNAAAQLVFCIDVRSEPFRRALEVEGKYQTLGFAGFFGLPISIRELHAAEDIACCPVLLKPQHLLKEEHICLNEGHKDNLRRKLYLRCKRVYESLKYTITAPFALAEILGPWAGINMFLKTFAPRQLALLKERVLQIVYPLSNTRISLEYKVDESGYAEFGISLQEQCMYAENVLRTMGLVSNFSPLVIFCGHASATANNPHASSLDCGACGARAGGRSAQVFASILNTPMVRNYLAEKNIVIPEDTLFLAAEHNTTTDDFIIYTDHSGGAIGEEHVKLLDALRAALLRAKDTNNLRRWQAILGRDVNNKLFLQSVGRYKKANNNIAAKSVDWAETRPEWGLARNASFIIAPRSWTSGLDLEGRAFLHSYDWEIDEEGKLLENILTAPMVVAQWINSQYLFATLNNIAYGSGSKVTQSITGKMGIMQGNASDLMYGPALQAVNLSDERRYHEPVRLLTCVYGLRAIVDDIIQRQDVLRKLFGNEWVKLVVFDAHEQLFYSLKPDLTWARSE